MGKISHKEKTMEQRQKESIEILLKYPDRACIFVEKIQSDTILPDLDKKKYLVPRSITAAQFILVIRNRIEIPKETALFFYTNKNIMSGNTLISEINDKHKDADGFLYIKYTGENCFG